MQGRAFLVATAFALLGVASLGMYAKQLRTEISGGEKVSVLIMSKNVKRAAPLTDEDLAVREVPVAYVDERFIRASEKPKILGLKLERSLDAQQLVEWHDLALAGNGSGSLGDRVSPGSRALTLHIPAQYMSVELVRPGDFVDLIGVLDEKRGIQESVVLLQKVLVLAVGVETTAAHLQKTNNLREEQLLTVSITLQESQVIALAVQKGPVIAILRSPNDPTVQGNVAALSQISNRPGSSPGAAPIATSQKPTDIAVAAAARKN
jgi:pilus assembly protein CpaB